jgi:hypothetical protein
VRAKYVPVRLAAAALAVAASAGCMSVGDDGGSRATPSRSAGQRGGEAPDGGSVVGGAVPDHRGTSDGKHARTKPRRSASGSASPSADESGPAEPRKPGKDGKDGKDGGGGKNPGPGGPAPTKEQPTPTRPAPEPTPTRETPAPSPEPSTAEPSSSAHPEPEPQLAERREPAPRAGIEA